MVYIKAIVFGALISTMVLARATDDPLEVVPKLDINRYIGLWHQIAAIPAWFQRSCDRDTTAEYSLESDGLIKVVNRCVKADGAVSSSSGAARINPKYNDQSKLQVSFVNIFGSWIWAFGGDYWVIDILDGPARYEYAVVGEPGRKYLWILARQPTLSADQLRKIAQQIKMKKFKVDSIIITQQGELKGKNLSFITN